MKNNLNKFVVSLLIGVICMLNSNSFAQGAFKYNQYVSKNPALNITIDYISDWLYREHKGIGDSLAGILFFVNKRDDSFKAKISLNAINSARIEAKPLTLEAVADDLVTKRLKFNEAKLLSKSKTTLQGLEAQDILLSYAAMDKIYSANPKSIPVKERMLVFKKDDNFYLLRYQNKEEEFEGFSEAFNHIISSLKFQK